jgi:hypothetical protein
MLQVRRLRYSLSLLSFVGLVCSFSSLIHLAYIFLFVFVNVLKIRFPYHFWNSNYQIHIPKHLRISLLWFNNFLFSWCFFIKSINIGIEIIFITNIFAVIVVIIFILFFIIVIIIILIIFFNKFAI